MCVFFRFLISLELFSLGGEKCLYMKEAEKYKGLMISVGKERCFRSGIINSYFNQRF